MTMLNAGDGAVAWLNMKTPSYQDRASHYKDEKIMRLSYIPNGNSCTGKATFFFTNSAHTLKITPETHRNTLLWRHNGYDGVSYHQPHDCLLNRLFRRWSQKTSKLRVTGLCAGNTTETGEFRARMASNAENVSIWWRHHEWLGYVVSIVRNWDKTNLYN